MYYHVYMVTSLRHILPKTEGCENCDEDIRKCDVCGDNLMFDTKSQECKGHSNIHLHVYTIPSIHTV